MSDVMEERQLIYEMHRSEISGITAQSDLPIENWLEEERKRSNMSYFHNYYIDQLQLVLSEYLDSFADSATKSKLYAFLDQQVLSLKEDIEQLVNLGYTKEYILSSEEIRIAEASLKLIRQFTFPSSDYSEDNTHISAVKEYQKEISYGFKDKAKNFVKAITTIVNTVLVTALVTAIAGVVGAYVGGALFGVPGMYVGSFLFTGVVGGFTFHQSVKMHQRSLNFQCRQLGNFLFFRESPRQTIAKRIGELAESVVNEKFSKTLDR